LGKHNGKSNAPSDIARGDRHLLKRISILAIDFDQSPHPPHLCILRVEQKTSQVKNRVAGGINYGEIKTVVNPHPELGGIFGSLPSIDNQKDDKPSELRVSRGAWKLDLTAYNNQFANQ
jgi:hypothetical protein